MEQGCCANGMGGVCVMSSAFGVHYSPVHLVKTSSWYRQFMNQAQLLADIYGGLFW